MKFIQKVLSHKKNITPYLPVLILLMILFVFYFPSFNLNFSLLDDGLTLRNARLLLESISELNINKVINVLFEPENGRVRPAYWIVQSILVWLSGHNPSLMHIFRFLTLLASVLFANKILVQLKINKVIRMFVFLIYSLNFQNLENYYRLGPAEPFLVLFYVVLTYIFFFLTKNKYKPKEPLIFLLFFMLGVFTKESFFLVAIPWIAGSVFLYISNKEKKVNLTKITYILIITALLSSLMFSIKGNYPKLENYSSNYVITLEGILANIKIFWRQLTFYQPIFFEVSVIYSLYLIYKIVFTKKFNKVSNTELFISISILQILLQLAFLLPWKFALDRYLALVNINLIFIYGYVIMEFYKFINKKFISTSKLLNRYQGIIYFLLLMILAAQFFVRSCFADANYQLFQKVDSETSRGTVEMLSKKIPMNQTVYVNYIKGNDNIEIYKATGWHLEEIYDRGDIEFSYLDEENLCTKEERYIFDRKSARFLDLQVFDNESFVLVDGGVSIYKPINYGVVIRSFYYKQKLPGWEQLDPFDWSLYLQKENTCIEEKYII
jgi:hypothetical protein